MQYGFPVPCAATSSNGYVAYDDNPMQIPNLAAARDVASSPSGWASLCEAAGLKPKGRDTWLIIRSCVQPHRRTRRSNLGTKNLGTSIDIVDIDQNAWPDFIPIKSRFVLAQTANALENHQGVVISKIVRDQIHGSFVIVVCQSQSWQTSITVPISTNL